MKAMDYVYAIKEKETEDNLVDGDSVIKTAMEKFDIPEGVELWELCETCNTTDVWNRHRKLAKEFVKGTLTEKTIWHLMWEASEWDEYDYGWVWLDRPMFFYKAGSDSMAERGPGESDVQIEMASIGTRSKSKWKKSLEWDAKAEEVEKTNGIPILNL